MSENNDSSTFILMKRRKNLLKVELKVINLTGTEFAFGGSYESTFFYDWGIFLDLKSTNI